MKALMIRHAASTGQANDAPLTEEGLAGAAALAPVLQSLGAGPLYSSPYLRARQTLAPYAEAAGLSVTPLEDLRERLLSSEDLPDWQAHLRRSFFNTLYAAPGGESHTHVYVRATRALRQIEEAGGDCPTFVTHGGVIAALLSRVDGSYRFEDWQEMRTPDLFEVEIVDRRIRSFRQLDTTLTV